MANYQEGRVRLTNTQLNKLKSDCMFLSCHVRVSE